MTYVHLMAFGTLGGGGQVPYLNYSDPLEPPYSIEDSRVGRFVPK